jgi:hypothetical protein
VRAIPWSGLTDGPEYDLCVKRPEGYYDVVSGVDGWTVITPFARYAHDGERWIAVPIAAPPRGKPGAVTRDDARVFAEAIIRNHGRTP